MSDAVPEELANRVRLAARDRCGYCLSPHLADDLDAIVVRSYWVEAGWQST
ncbi:MAG TPA: hypothetical protein PK867_06030 [Pirellulales bacterium]|nr:hypothetical protein [Pirellulales bacterium]